MSVLIKGMKMPISCHECVAGYGGFCFVAPPESDANCPNEGRPEWCPIIEIPTHGRLIDADELQKDFNALLPFKENNDITEDYVDGIMVGCDTLQNAPAVIEAEEVER